MTAKAEYIPNGYVCNKCGSRMDAIITPPLSTLGKMKLVCNNCNKYMSKEKILEEFENKYSSFELCNQISKPELDKLKNFLSQAIDQTREETIREVEEILPDEYDLTESESVSLLNQIKQSLNKLKK